MVQLVTEQRHKRVPRPVQKRLHVTTARHRRPDEPLELPVVAGLPPELQLELWQRVVQQLNELGAVSGTSAADVFVLLMVAFRVRAAPETERRGRGTLVELVGRQRQRREAFSA